MVHDIVSEAALERLIFFSETFERGSFVTLNGLFGDHLKGQHAVVRVVEHLLRVTLAGRLDLALSCAALARALSLLRLLHLAIVEVGLLICLVIILTMAPSVSVSIVLLGFLVAWRSLGASLTLILIAIVSILDIVIIFKPDLIATLIIIFLTR